jgi:hypothetical protein
MSSAVVKGKQDIASGLRGIIVFLNMGANSSRNFSLKNADLSLFGKDIISQ